jgi:hypothetical protein
MVSAPGAGIPNNFQDPAISRPLPIGFGIVAIATAAGFDVDSPDPPALASDGVELAVCPASGADSRKIDMPMKVKESDDKIKITGASASAERFKAKIETSRFIHAASSGAGLLCASA